MAPSRRMQAAEAMGMASSMGRWLTTMPARKK